MTCERTRRMQSKTVAKTRKLPRRLYVENIPLFVDGTDVSVVSDPEPSMGRRRRLAGFLGTIDYEVFAHMHIWRGREVISVFVRHKFMDSHGHSTVSTQQYQ